MKLFILNEEGKSAALSQEKKFTSLESQNKKVGSKTLSFFFFLFGGGGGGLLANTRAAVKLRNEAGATMKAGMS